MTLYAIFNDFFSEMFCSITNFSYLCIMKDNKEQQKQAMLSQEEAFRGKTHN